MAGVQHQELGQLDEALQHFNMAITKDREQGSYYFNRAIIFSKQEKVDRAIEDYTKALGLVSDPEFQYQAHFNRGICYRRKGPEGLEESIRDL